VITIIPSSFCFLIQTTTNTTAKMITNTHLRGLKEQGKEKAKDKGVDKIDACSPSDAESRSDNGSPALGSDVARESDDDGPDSFDASPLEDRRCRSIVQPRTPVARGHRPQSSPQAFKILVAEDAPVNQKVLVAMLKNLGYSNVVIAMNGKIAVDMVMENRETDPIDLVFMDCLMPEMDGWEATRAIRKWEAERNEEEAKDADYLPTKKARLAIIALTAHVTMRDRDECLDSGMDDFLVKPVNLEQLQFSLQQWLPGDKPSSVGRWPLGVASGNIMKVPSKLCAPGDTRSERSYTSYNSSVASSALEEVSFIIQAKLRSEDGSLDDGGAVMPSMAGWQGRPRRKSFTNNVSPLIVLGSTSRARSVQSDCSPGISIFAGGGKKSILTHLKPNRSTVDAAMEQADLPDTSISNTGIYPLLHTLRTNSGSSEDRDCVVPPAAMHGHRATRSSPLITNSRDIEQLMTHISPASEGNILGNIFFFFFIWFLLMIYW
jgi:CheY-like chemotaxis protein